MRTKLIQIVPPYKTTRPLGFGRCEVAFPAKSTTDLTKVTDYLLVIRGTSIAGFFGMNAWVNVGGHGCQQFCLDCPASITELLITRYP